jgi:dTDP-L-rhamnose 4-epimerase
MAERILVTGGAGFIGSHLVDALVAEGHDVRIFDNLSPQVHGSQRKPPAYLNRDAECVVGDVRDYDSLKSAVEGVDTVFHEAAAVGVGQSMYQIREYVETNALGTANLLHIIANERTRVRKIIVASSMSVYGEGKYFCRQCGEVYPSLRPLAQLERRDWEMRCPRCGELVEPRPTDEGKPLAPTSTYAITKRDQEELCLTVGFAYRIPTVALRYFNVYGERQALSNPYTGVAAIFAARLLNRHAPIIFEDGQQARDFIHVSDVVRANVLALRSDACDYEAVNVGTGAATSVRQIAAKLMQHFGIEMQCEYPQKFRAGDIRHCFADVTKARERLGFQASVAFDEGVRIVANWARQQEAEDRVERAARELEEKGLTR